MGRNGANPLDRINARKDAHAEAMIAQAMAGQAQRQPSREERVVGTITEIRKWSKGWKKELEDVLRDDQAQLSDSQKVAFAAHLLEVQTIYEQATKLFAKSLEDDLRYDAFTKGMNERLAAIVPELESMIVDRHDRSVAAKAKEDPALKARVMESLGAPAEAPPQSDVIEIAR